MANTFKLKRSAVPAKVPTTGDLQLGELALNTYDGKLYTKKDDGTASIVELSGGGGGGSGGTYTVSATAPGSPAAGDRWLDSDNGIEYTYVNDGNSSAWVETGAPGVGQPGPPGPNGTTEISFSIPSNISTGTGSIRWYFTGNVTISNVVATVGTAPTGASLIFDVNKNDTTIFTTQANRPTITATNFTDLTSAPDVTTFVSGDYVTVDVDQVGSTVPGADAVIRLAVS